MLLLLHRSKRIADIFYYDDRDLPTRTAEAESFKSEVLLFYRREHILARGHPGISYHARDVSFLDTEPLYEYEPPWHIEYMGFGLGRVVNISPAPVWHPEIGPLWSIEYSVYLPHWFIAILLLLYPLYSVARSVCAWRSNRIGCCTVCGYDLRATPDRCPECGKVAQRK